MVVGDRGWAFVISCEHGGNAVPAWLADRFAGADAALASHRGWDPGALGITQTLSDCLGVVSIIARISRLVVDPNRSEDSPTLFSEFTRDLPSDQRDRILAEHYHPHRSRVEAAVRAGLATGRRVAHVSVHTFTPVLDGAHRAFHAGVLFDPAREPEATIAREWIVGLWNRGAPIDVRANQPYLGTDDGLTTTLRGVFGAEDYIGIEVEVRNDLVGTREQQTRWGSRLASALMPILSAQGWAG